MKITLMTHVFLPENTAGTEVLTYNTAKAFQKMGHEVQVITSLPILHIKDSHTTFDQYEYDGIPVRRYYHCNERMKLEGNIVTAGYDNALFNNWFEQYLADFQPDIIQAFHLSHLSASAVDVCHSQNIPIVFTPTDFWFICLTYQLRLPDNNLCRGPDENSLNCLRHTVAKFQPQKVYSLIDILPDWLMLLCLRLCLKLPFKLNVLESIRSLYRRKDFMIKRLNSFSRVLSPSNVMTEQLCDNGLDKALVHKIPFGILTPKDSELSKLSNNKQLTLGYIGSISEHKGLHILIDAVQQLEPDLAIKVLIYGDQTTYPDYTKRLLKMIGLDDRFQFKGTFKSNHIYQVFQEFDALVVPSIWYENTPLVLYSAQAAKTPVIATNLGGLSEVIEHNVNGMLFDVLDADALSVEIKRLYDDQTLLSKMASCAINVNSAEDYANSLMYHYGEVLKEREHRK